MPTGTQETVSADPPPINPYAEDRLPAERTAANGPAVLVRQRLKTASAGHRMDVALTLDACSGAVDMKLIQGLIELDIPTTVFVTGRWLKGNEQAIGVMLQHPELFEFENHGAMHVPPVIGAKVYGIAGVRDEAALREEVSGGTEAMARVLRRGAQWYRGAGAHYDGRSMAIIDEMGYRIAGFSVNGDDGATLSAQGVAGRLSRVRPGDIVLAHMNHPKSGTGAGLLKALPGLKEKGYRFVRLSDAEGVERYAVRVKRLPDGLTGEP